MAGNAARLLFPDSPLGYAGGSDLYAYCQNGPLDGSDPLGLLTVAGYDFDGETISSGLQTGWAGFSTAVWQTPGLKQLNQKYHIYAADCADQDAPGFKASVAFGRLGVDSLATAGGLKCMGMIGPLAGWWNQGIGRTVPFTDLLKNEIGQNTLNDADYAKYAEIEDPVARGEQMIADKGLFGAMFGGGSAGFLNPGSGGTLLTGPTQGARIGMRAFGAAGFLITEYATNQNTFNSGFNDVVSSLR